MSLLGQIVSSIFGGNYPLVPVKSNIDGEYYRVRDMPDKQFAADLLAKIRMKLTQLVSILMTKYPDKEQVKLLQKNYVSDPKRFIESTPEAEHTSYSVNKGEEIHLCLRQRSSADERLVKENVMIFVSLHELAHVCTHSVGHGPDFWNNFGWLLKEAEEHGIYKYTDFTAQPVSYCGVSITDQPRYDPMKDGTNFQIGTIQEKKK